MLYDPDQQMVLAEGNTIPLAWDGTDADLGPGIDATMAAASRTLSASRVARAATADSLCSSCT